MSLFFNSQTGGQSKADQSLLNGDDVVLSVREYISTIISHVGMGQNQTTRELQVLILVSIYQDSILALPTIFGPCRCVLPQSHSLGIVLDPTPLGVLVS